MEVEGVYSLGFKVDVEVEGRRWCMEVEGV